MGIVVGIVVMSGLAFRLLFNRSSGSTRRQKGWPQPPPRPSPAPDAVQDWKRFAKDKGWPEVSELRGTMAGVYKEKSGEFSVLVRPDSGYSLLDSWTKETPPNTLGVVFVQAVLGYENKIIVPKPGTHIQVLQDVATKKAYFIGIIN